MKQINPDRFKFNYERHIIKPSRPNIINARMNLSKNYKNNKSRPRSERKELMNETNFSNQSNQSFHSSRSLKEFSYFDWSKVKLLKEEYRLNEVKPHNIYNTKDFKLAPVRANSHNNLDILHKHSNELPQVITIRFT